MKQLNVQPARRAVLYLRTRTVGGDDQMVDADLERQRIACQHVARRHGAHVVHEYAAIGGARDVHVRSIVGTMLTAVARDHVDYVITTGIDRLCRGPARADRELMNTIRRSGARLLCPRTWDVLPPRLDIDDLAEAARTPGLRPAAVGRTS
jgi:DNA invertase Pin-like site-specific DNA recombinase